MFKLLNIQKYIDIIEVTFFEFCKQICHNVQNQLRIQYHTIEQDTFLFEFLKIYQLLLIFGNIIQNTSNSML